MATARIGKAQREREALEEFGRMLSALPDPRRKQGQRYPFESVIVIALMSMVCGADDASGMEVWGELNEEFLSEFLPLPHGTTSQDVYLAVFAALKPEAFNAMFLAWMELLKGRLSAVGRHIAVDGKTSRRSFDLGKEQPAIHTVSAWLSGEGFVLGQFKTQEKSNEITAIPELLKMIDLRGATVTVDALGCQTEIAEEIVAGDGDYLLAVKENQPTLHADIQEAFADAVREPRQPMDLPLAVERWTDTTKGH
ncbi:ISAs1 family transposase, partial [Myxococcota bacterium]|nr:ISAs1 family transposase [Myxococcota bacterium]